MAVARRQLLVDASSSVAEAQSIAQCSVSAAKKCLVPLKSVIVVAHAV